MNKIKISRSQVAGKNIILYGARKQAALDVEALKGANIICFCDADERKQGTNYLGYPVVSIKDTQEIIKQNSEVLIYKRTKKEIIK